ncbi:acetyl-lysine deacetylase [Halosimplex carlsbadense 2-9-1]|uniref:Putative [LysW]-lysine/[LysW]-ornithine hydrolase n=1 Tax=Halosimplex carlsbadense 2-9-1 TaxID=797114 RepID=M0D5Q1_9EURY|nr:[LysW]-lysine hydrolase [Halosimplex carlsbadense]ELZ29484.1 acetyl-lysine deacetylase [Halosimplex carlsbadense 2-9-1]
MSESAGERGGGDGEEPTPDLPVDEQARELLIDVVDTPSVTGEEEEAAQVLVDFFEAHDREVWVDDVGNVRAPADDSVLLTSHIDTVPGDIPVRVEEGEEGEEQLWGRGSVDAKGPLCSMAVAAVRTGASFVGVVGEEVDSRGARHLVADRDAEPGAVINGEPSGWDGITLGYRGLLGGTYVATSESGHSSRPENNAIQDAIGWWSAVEEEFDHDDWVPVFERVTAKPISFEGGISDDGLSVEATADVQLRVPPEYTTEEIREIADGHLTNGTVHWHDAVEPVMMNPRTAAARAFRAAVRQVGGDPRLLRKTGTSDMNVYAQEWDCPMVTYGPGDSDLDHAPDEHVSLAEYDRAVAVLETATEQLQS